MSEEKQGLEDPKAHDSWPQTCSEPPCSPGCPPPGGGVRVSFPHPAHPQRPEVLRWIRSPVALDPGCCLALWLGGRAVPAAPRSAPPPSPRVLTSDWLLDTPCRQSAQTPGKTKLYQAYPTRPAPGLPRKLRTEILRLGF